MGGGEREKGRENTQKSVQLRELLEWASTLCLLAMKFVSFCSRALKDNEVYA